MKVKDKEKEIKTKIEEITGKKIKLNKATCYDIVKNFRKYRAKKILLFSASFDYFLIEEEGRLNNLFSEWYSLACQENPPNITHVETDDECIKSLKEDNFDLLIIFNILDKEIIHRISKQIKGITDTPIILLGNNVKELEEFQKDKYKIKKVYTWNGDGKIILDIIQNFEDEKNLDINPGDERKKIILIIENSIQYYSSYISIVNEELLNFLKKITNKELNYEQKLIRYKRRPFVIHASDFKKGKEFYEKYKDEIICIITDNYGVDNEKDKALGLNFAKKAIAERPDLPILIQSSEPIKKDIKINKVNFISKNSHSLNRIIRAIINKSLGPYSIVVEDENNEKIVYIKTINELERVLNDIKEKSILKYSKENVFSKWLKNIGEIELSEKIRTSEDKIKNAVQLKDSFLQLLEDYKYSINQISVASFDRNFKDPIIKISRIGEGVLGGKARGIAFLAKILSKYIDENMFPGLKVTIPRSIVLSTDIFDNFMEKNQLNDLDFNSLSDERISSRFLKADLPPMILGDLRSFVRKSNKPLIVRSSGMLEDSLRQPFAGVYASMLLPNVSLETDLRFQEVCNSIKHVYASTYFRNARNYIKSTPKQLGDEKMAILIQELVGKQHENYFYPTISGVAKSYNYYPSGRCKPEDGIVYLALGLGKSIVEGGSTFAFCPEKPKVPVFGTQKEFMKYAQNSFYALNLRSIYRFVEYDEDTSLEKLEIDIAKKHSSLDKISSTYFYQDDKFYPGVNDEGAIVIDFSPIINYDELPLAKAIKLILTISEIALGYPVEIEFALNISNKESDPSEMIILQIRNMIPPHKKIEINIEDIPCKEILISSKNSLGNGIIENIKDILFVDQKSFDMSNSNQVINQIRKINTKLVEEKRPYVLIGPGRWGSSDPWLGIPVIWSDIAGAKVIVETPYKERHIDPSQGSHFFHDMIASNVGYIITKKEDDINWKWIKSQKIVEETDFIKHIQITKPLQAIIDGKKAEAVIRQENKS